MMTPEYMGPQVMWPHPILYLGDKSQQVQYLNDHYRSMEFLFHEQVKTPITGLRLWECKVIDCFRGK